MEPFGEWRDDYRIGQLCAVIANVNRDTKKRQKPFQPQDFMPFEQAERQRDKARGKGQIAEETVEWFFGRAGLPVPKESVEDALRRVAPNLPTEKLAQLTARTMKRGD